MLVSPANKGSQATLSPINNHKKKTALIAVAKKTTSSSALRRSAQSSGGQLVDLRAQTLKAARWILPLPKQNPTSSKLWRSAACCHPPDCLAQSHPLPLKTTGQHLAALLRYSFARLCLRTAWAGWFFPGARNRTRVVSLPWFPLFVP